MKITDIKTTPFTIPFDRPGIRGWTKHWAFWPSTIIELETDEGITGIGEGRTLPSADVLKRWGISQSGPQLIGQDPFNIERIVGPSPNTGNGVIAAIEMACWDIIGKALHQPVYKLLGGKIWDKVPITMVTHTENPKRVAAECVEAKKQGIKGIKLKVGSNEKQDIAILREARAAVGEDVYLRPDFNEAISIPTAIRIINKMAKYDPQYVEQPCSGWNLDAFLWIQAKTTVPLCACGSSIGNAQVLRLIKRQAVEFISSDVYRSGGLLGFKKLDGICGAAGIPIVACVHGPGGVGEAAYLHAFATCHSCMYPHDMKAANVKLGTTFDSVITAPFIHENGYLKVPEGPGLGVELDREKLAKYANVYREEKKKGHYGHGSPPEISLIDAFAEPNLPVPYYWAPRY